MKTIIVWFHGEPWLCATIQVLRPDGTIEHRWVAERPVTGEEIESVQEGDKP